MAIQSTYEQLEETQASIRDCLKNQSYGLDGRSVNRATLASLTERENILKKQYNIEIRKNAPRVAYANMSNTNNPRCLGD